MRSQSAEKIGGVAYNFSSALYGKKSEFLVGLSSARIDLQDGLSLVNKLNKKEAGCESAIKRCVKSIRSSELFYMPFYSALNRIQEI